MNKPNTPLHLLNYEPVLPPNRCITIHDTETCLKITLGAYPAWIKWVSILTTALPGLIQVICTLEIIRLLRSFGAFQSGPMIQFMGLHFVVALAWFADAIYLYLHYRKWGRTPGTLFVEAEGVTFVRPGWWNMRHTFWPAESIKRLSVRRLKPLFGTRTIADLRVDLRRRFPRSFRLTTKDPSVIDAVEARIAKLWEEHSLGVQVLDSKR